MTIRAGKLRHRLIIQEQETAKGTRGQRTSGWIPVGDPIWGKVESLAGGEREQARQIYPSATLSVQIRFRAGMTTENRIKFGDRILNIGYIENEDQRNEELVMLCGEDR